MSNYLDRAEECAQATGQMFLLGVRPDGSKFATCGSIEYDGPWTHSVDDVIEGHIQRAEEDAGYAQTVVLKAERIKKLREV